MPAREETVRAFVALPCPDRLRTAIGEALPGWRELGGRLRWTPPERIHLTLRFLGDSTPDEIAAVREGLRAVATRAETLEIRPDEVGAFPHWGRPRVVWLGLDGGDALAELAEAVEEVARAAGFEPDERDFRPHLTLARVKGRRGLERVVRAVRGWRPETGSEIVSGMILYESELAPEGARHTPIERFRLGGEP